MDDIDNPGHIFSFYDCVEHCDGSCSALSIHTGHSISSVVQVISQHCMVILDNHTHNLGADSQPIFNPHANIIPSGKTCCVGQVCNDVMGMANNLRDDRYPDEYFNKTKDRSKVSFTPGDEDDA